MDRTAVHYTEKGHEGFVVDAVAAGFDLELAAHTYSLQMTKAFRPGDILDWFVALRPVAARRVLEVAVEQTMSYETVDRRADGSLGVSKML